MDSIISLAKKNTPVEDIITLVVSDNSPPGVTKGPVYDSWKMNAGCDMKILPISFLHGLPADIYSPQLVESSQLINDMNIYKMKIDQFQVNTKFLNSLSPEWSKFVTDVKLVKDLHTSNFNQLHAYLEQHELHANEVRIMRERNQDPLAFIANQQMTPPHFNTYQSSYNISNESSNLNCSTSNSKVAYQSPQAPTQLMTESPFIDSGFAVPVFSPGDDPIACLNKAMVFLMAVASLRWQGYRDKFRETKAKNYLELIIRAMLLVQGEILQVDRQELLNATTAKVKDIWIGNALSLSEQGMQHDPGIPTSQAYTVISHNAAF
ncbi:hypothetical protein Tco_0059994 [Tanacetum coccineum]